MFTPTMMIIWIIASLVFGLIKRLIKLALLIAIIGVVVLYFTDPASINHIISNFPAVKLSGKVF